MNKFVSLNPASQEILWSGDAAAKKEIDAAILAAEQAFSMWKDLSLEERTGFLKKYQQTLESRKEDLAYSLSEENGKPLWDSLAEIQAMINKIPISIEAYQERCPTKTKDLPQGHLITRHKPHGVVAVFGPFNFPFHLPNGHIVPALLAGNTVVFKPSELTPRCGEKLLECLTASGLPSGVVNLVQGAGETGQLLAQHPKLNGIFFTGSERTGKALAESLSKHPDKILALELGGNNPLVISDIDDPKCAAYLTIQSAYATSGQRCTCARRLIVVDGPRANVFMDHLQSMIKDIRVGSFTERPEPFMGPVISLDAARKILASEASLLSQGGKSLIPMRQLDPKLPFITPGLMDVTAIQDRVDEEIFGPLLQVIHVKDLEEAISEARATRFGLTAGIFTKNHEEYVKFLNRIRAGVINWNTPLTGASSQAPFGGIGSSGNHRPSAYYAADYCAYPVASIEADALHLPAKMLPGIKLE